MADPSDHANQLRLWRQSKLRSKIGTRLCRLAFRYSHSVINHYRLARETRLFLHHTIAHRARHTHNSFRTKLEPLVQPQANRTRHEKNLTKVPEHRHPC